MTATELIKTASEEIGYIGKKSNSQLDDKTANAQGKYTKYARDLYNASYYNGNKNGYDYCCVFVDWCFWKASGCDKKIADKYKPVGIYGAGVNYIKGMFPKDRIDMVPRVGDQIIYKTTKGELYHTGIVSNVDMEHGTIDTIEGNLYQNDVGCRHIQIDDNSIDCFIHPYYDKEPSEYNDEKIRELLLELVKELRL